MQLLGIENTNNCRKCKKDGETLIFLRCQCPALLGKVSEARGVKYHVVETAYMAKYPMISLVNFINPEM